MGADNLNSSRFGNPMANLMGGLSSMMAPQMALNVGSPSSWQTSGQLSGYNPPANYTSPPPHFGGPATTGTSTALPGPAAPGQIAPTGDPFLGQSLSTTGGYGGQVTNPDYTAAYGNRPYADYLAQFQAETAQRRAAYDAAQSTLRPGSIDPATGQRVGRRLAFNAGVPIPEFSAIWENPTGPRNPNQYNAFESAGRSLTPLLGKKLF